MARKPDLPSIVDPYTGETRRLGTIPSDPRLVASLPPYMGEVLPESELKAFHDYPEHIKIRDQDGLGACNGYASAAAVEGARYVAGMDHVDLSGDFVYSILCNGIDRGSNILQGYKMIGERGVAPASLVPHLTLNPRRLTTEAHESAKRFRMEFGESYQSWRQIVSGIMLREVMNLSVCVGRNFNDLDSEGVAGTDRGMGNHAVSVGLGLKKSARHGWLILCRNSWSTRWGAEGFCWLSERVIEAGSYFECFSVKAVVDDPDAEDTPPIARALANLPRRATWKPSALA